MNTDEYLIDGVRRSPCNGITAVIIGAGVGGLTAALECWRKGCDVIVLERAAKLSPFGDFFTIHPAGLSTLHHYPTMFEEYKRNVNDCTVLAYSPDGECLRVMAPEWHRPSKVPHAAPAVKTVSFLNRRRQWAEMLLSQVSRLGIPVHFDTNAVRIDDDNSASVTVLDQRGSIFTGDLCIASSGIGSSITGLEDTGLGDTKVLDSGFAVARVAWPTSDIKPGSPACALIETLPQQPQFRVYFAAGIHLIIFLTRDYVAWGITHKADERSEESWQNFINPADIIATIKRACAEWDPAVLDFLEQTPAKVVDWNLRVRDCAETWTSPSGRVLRLGDCAHPFLPTAGNGAVTAIEDGITIAECLRLAGKAGVSQATKVHNKLRFERVSILQQTGFYNREQLHTMDIAALRSDPTYEPGFFKIGRWVWGHNAETYAKENYALCLDSFTNGEPFTNTNIPPGHIYKSWTVKSEAERMRAGIPSDLKSNGEWGY